MKKIITGACILLVTVMFSPAIAQNGPTKRPDRQGDRIDKHQNRQGDRYGDRSIGRGRDHWRGQRSTHFSSQRNYRGNRTYTRSNNNHRRHMYSRYHNKYRRHGYSNFNNRHHKHMYSMSNRGHYRHRNNW
jgi:hypothetical protein